MAKRMRKLLVTPHRKFSQTFVTGKKSTLYSVRSYVYCVGRWDLRFSRTELINKNNFPPSLFLLLHVKLISTIKIWIC